MMVQLKRSEIRTLKDVFAWPQGAGYVLDFSNRTFAEFFEDEFRIDIDDAAIAGEGSKCTRLLTFLERTDAYTAAKVLRTLWDHREGMVSRRSAPLNSENESGIRDAYLRILTNIEAGTSTPSSAALERHSADRTLDELVADIERTLQANKPEAAMDHLHTYCMKKFSHLLTLRGIECAQEEALHARFGKYRKALLAERELTEFTDRALKGAISLMDAYNTIRNDHSLAHDNPILEPQEARYIFENISALLMFVRAIEAGRYDE